MNVLSKILLSLMILASAAYAYYVLVLGPCFLPITYDIGDFDTKFGITEESFKDSILQAELIWEKAAGRNLFDFKEGGSVPIHLIYDTRQATVDKNNQLETKIESTQDTAESVKFQFESAKREYETAKADYERMIENYRSLQATYNNEVNEWNSKGGAPKNEFNKLEAQRAELSNMQSLIEKRRLEVNELAAEVNNLVSKYNSLVKVVNKDIDAINESADKEFEQGEYIVRNGEEKINIYEFESRSQLIRILAHELGHAIGIGHNENEKSIMYYLNKGTELVPTPEDIRDLKAFCKIK